MSKNKERATVTYIVVIHGMGEQREHESILPIVNGFASARQCDAHSKVTNGCSPLTQGMLDGQGNSMPWVEFEGIPSTPSNGSDYFIGKEVTSKTTTGENFRFVDLYWADIMQNNFENAGQSVESWTQSVIDRLKIHFTTHENSYSDGHSTVNPESWSWIPEFLEAMRKGVLPLKRFNNVMHRFLRGTNSHLDDTVFNRFLGDVQLYGEHAPTRQQAIYRFHNKLAKVHQAHLKEKAINTKIGDPRYVILAHSLGSIMSFDALVYAHAKKNISDRGLHVLNLNEVHLPNYKSTRKYFRRQPRMDWVKYVSSFITMGSPIDKFLILWWMNYKHLENPSKQGWPEDLSKNPKIRHYNYCDEMDPVGHKLDTVAGTDLYNKIFENKEDDVLMHYGSFAAHTKYWHDIPLLKHIIEHAIDGKEDNSTDTNKNNTTSGISGDKHSQAEIDEEQKPPRLTMEYLKTLLLSYFFIPLAGMFLVGVTAYVMTKLEALGGVLSGVLIILMLLSYRKHPFWLTGIGVLFLAAIARFTSGDLQTHILTGTLVTLLTLLTMHFTRLVIQWRQMGRCSKLASETIAKSFKSDNCKGRVSKKLGEWFTRRQTETALQYLLLLLPVLWGVLSIMNIAIHPRSGFVSAALLLSAFSISTVSLVEFVRMKHKYGAKDVLIWPLKLLAREREKASCDDESEKQSADEKMEKKSHTEKSKKPTDKERLSPFVVNFRDYIQPKEQECETANVSRKSRKAPAKERKNKKLEAIV